PELFARADAELPEHLVQVVLDRARADEQLRADLRIGVTVSGQTRDLRLLRRQRVARVHRDPADGLARGQQLAARAIGKRLGPHAVEAVVGGTEDLARVGATVLASKPFAVDELAARELDGRPAA